MSLGYSGLQNACFSHRKEFLTSHLQETVVLNRVLHRTASVATISLCYFTASYYARLLLFSDEYYHFYQAKQ